MESIPLPFDLLLRAPTASFFDSVSDSVTLIPQTNGEDTEPVRLGAVCVLRADDSTSATGSPVRILALASGEAFTATLQHAYTLALSDADHRTRLVDDYLELVATVPVYDVSFERGLERLDVVLDAIQQRLDLAPPPG